MGGRCIGTVGMNSMGGRTNMRALGIGSVRKVFGKRRYRDYIRERGKCAKIPSNVGFSFFLALSNFKRAGRSGSLTMPALKKSQNCDTISMSAQAASKTYGLHSIS